MLARRPFEAQLLLLGRLFWQQAKRHPTSSELRFLVWSLLKGNSHYYWCLKELSPILYGLDSLHKCRIILTHPPNRRPNRIQILVAVCNSLKGNGMIVVVICQNKTEPARHRTPFDTDGSCPETFSSHHNHKEMIPCIWEAYEGVANVFRCLLSPYGTNCSC